MDLREMGAFLTERFTADMFRLETLSHYRSASDGGEFEAYLRGEAKPVAESAWLDTLRADTSARPSKRWRKVHVVRGALSGYERYEFEWGFQDTVAAGEDVRIIESAEPPGLDALVGDFYVVDGQHVVALRYDDRGSFEAAEVVEGRAVGALIAVRDLVWRQAVPFGDWWPAHPEFHRSTGAA